MTRWARSSLSQNKRPHEASSWKDLRQTQSYSYSKGYKQRQGGGFKHHNSKTTPGWKRGDGILDCDTDSELKVKWTRPDEPTTSLVTELEQIKTSTKLSPTEVNEISELIKKDQRRENRRVKRLNKRQSGKICYNCREVGHDVANCPKLENSTESGSGICFKCGSTEHTLYQCKVKVPEGTLPYAKCFVCGEQGHLSKQCPDNPRGLYPNGGCCRLCGSVEHYKKDCPELQKREGIEDYKLTTISSGMASVDAEVDMECRDIVTKKKQPKIVTF